jgi:hypothetical protein
MKYEYAATVLHTSQFTIAVVVNLGYAYPRGYAETSYINQKETQEPSEPWTRSDIRTREDLPSSWGARMRKTRSVISITGQNHTNNI